MNSSNTPSQTTPPLSIRPNDPPPLPYATVDALVRDCAGKYGDAPFATTALPTGASVTLSYDEIERQSAAFAKYLRTGIGLAKGDVVGVQAPNCVSYVVGMLGVLRAGLVLSNINPLYTPHETQRQLKDCGAKALIVIDLFGDKVADSIKDTKVSTVISVSLLDFFPPARAMILGFVMKRVKRMVPPMTAPHVRLADALSAGAGLSADVAQYTSGASPDDTIFYQYSGGTTGVSKGVELTTRNLLVNIEQAAAIAPDTLGKTGRRALMVMPLYHMFGLFITLSGMMRGGQAILTPSARPLSNLRKPFEKFKPDVFPGVNTLFAHLMREPWFKNAPPQIDLTLTGATALHADVGAAWTKMTGGPIAVSYGMTETTTVLTTNPPDDRNRPGSVGLPLPGAEVRIIDGDDNPSPPGEAGEILARGPQVTKGYLNKPEENEKAFLDGWIRTGDMGYLDKDGYLYLVDRKKDMIIVSGFNVFPNEIEETLTACKGVTEAGVVGVKDKDDDEIVAAYIVKSSDSLTEDDIKEFCTDRLTNYKRPKIIAFVDELPKTPIGKVLRKDLRDRAQADFNA
ncbi:MAG: AMP-binding protein [Pseudomonadota bacterium]